MMCQHAFAVCWQVLLYALMSPQDAYTDFHVDFGGSSVWYHIISGRKVHPWGACTPFCALLPQMFRLSRAACFCAGVPGVSPNATQPECFRRVGFISHTGAAPHKKWLHDVRLIA